MTGAGGLSSSLQPVTAKPSALSLSKGALRGSPRRRGGVGDRGADRGEASPQAFQIAAP
jgi:hypothetical protein